MRNLWEDKKKIKERVKLTDITGSPARRCHDTRVFHFGQAEVADHDLTVLVWAVIQQILRLDVLKNNNNNKNNESIDGMQEKLKSRKIKTGHCNGNLLIQHDTSDEYMHAGLDSASSAGFSIVQVVSRRYNLTRPDVKKRRESGRGR
jgi:hypothetical protein